MKVGETVLVEFDSNQRIATYRDVTLVYQSDFFHYGYCGFWGSQELVRVWEPAYKNKNDCLRGEFVGGVEELREILSLIPMEAPQDGNG